MTSQRASRSAGDLRPVFNGVDLLNLTLHMKGKRCARGLQAQGLGVAGEGIHLVKDGG